MEFETFPPVAGQKPTYAIAGESIKPEATNSVRCMEQNFYLFGTEPFLTLYVNVEVIIN